jgi:hypothetical protein
MYRSRHLLTAAATLLLLSACAEERAPINRVQPNVIRKSDLDGEWYYQQTVIDMDTSANYSVIGDNAFWNLERIRWDIQESYLYARRAYEWVDNSDNTNYEFDGTDRGSVGATITEDGQPYLGAVVAAFRIESHFDIRREHNPTTGEEINVIVENTSDRPWYDREYMRVDWAENLATDFDFDYFYYADGELNIDPVPFYVQENGPEELRPNFDYDDDGLLSYFDVVQQLTVHPDTTYYDYYGMDFPTCWFFSQEGVDCATTTLTVRASFVRTTDEVDDYEPLEYKGTIGDVFGFWTTDRLRYSHRQGYREFNRRRFAQRHNIWERSHTDQVCQPNLGCAFECAAEADCAEQWCAPGDEACIEEMSTVARCIDGMCTTPCEEASDCQGTGGACIDGMCQCDINADCTEPGSRCDDNLAYQPSVCSLPWTETHFDTDCTTDAECSDVPGSVCEQREDGLLSQCTIPGIARHGSQTCNSDSQCPEGTECLNLGRCTIPYRDRTPKPVIFYLTGGWPEDLIQAGIFDRIEADYDWTMRRAVAVAQILSEMELAATEEGGEQRIAELRQHLDSLEMACETDDQCEAYWSGSTCATDGPYAGHCSTPVRQMFYFCNNPVRPDDATECGETGTITHFGDIRYNQLHYSREWNPLSPLGQSPTAPDPLSGRIFGSTVSLYDAADTTAFRYWEWASLLNGNLDPEDYVDGEDLTHWLGARRARLDAARERTVSQDEIREMYRARGNDWMQWLRNPQSIRNGPPQGQGYEVLNRALRELRDTGVFDADRDEGDGFLHSLHQSPIEDLMMNDEIMMASNFLPGTPLTGEVRDRASMLSPEYRAWRSAQRQWLNEHNWGRNITYADMFYMPLEQMARHIQDMSQEEAFQYIRLRTWESLIVHELGHNMGLYHNFAGSEDVVNFPSEWWAVRTDNFTRRPRSRLEDPVTDSEIDNGLDDLGYSSIMDYNGNYASGERLGRYDRAALMFGYGGGVEVYREVQGGLGPGDLAEWWSSMGSPLSFPSTRPTSLHYTEMYNRMGRDLFDEDNRMILPASALNRDDNMTVEDPFDPAGRAYTRVPYLFCSDYNADLGENCHRWDFGYDTYDRMQDIIQRDDLYYLANNFRRGSIFSDPERFVSYYYERQYERFKYMHDYYNLIDAICHMYYSPEACEEFMTDPEEGFGVYTVAVHDGFNHLAQTLTRPDINIYDIRTHADGSESYAESGWITGSTLGLPLGEGAYFTTTWWDPNGGAEECGLQFWECLHHYGFYLNKLMALITMAEAETFFVARDTAEDIRMWRISYYDDFAQHIIRLIGGVMSEDHGDVGPLVTRSDEVGPDGEALGELIRRDYVLSYSDPDARPVFEEDVPDDAEPIDPYTGFTVQLYAAVIGFGRFHTNFDNRFITAGRMWVCGGDHGVDPCANADGVHDPDACDEHGVNPDEPIIRFQDPETGMAYCAINRADGMGIAQRMLIHANRMRGRTDYCDREDEDAIDACVGGLSPDDRRYAEGQMLLYRDQLDIMVHLTARYDNWMFTYGDPFNPGDVPEDW